MAYSVSGILPVTTASTCATVVAGSMQSWWCAAAYIQQLTPCSLHPVAFSLHVPQKLRGLVSGQGAENVDQDDCHVAFVCVTPPPSVCMRECWGGGGGGGGWLQQCMLCAVCHVLAVCCVARAVCGPQRNANRSSNSSPPNSKLQTQTPNSRNVRAFSRWIPLLASCRRSDRILALIHERHAC